MSKAVIGGVIGVAALLGTVGLAVTMGGGSDESSAEPVRDEITTPERRETPRPTVEVETNSTTIEALPDVADARGDRERGDRERGDRGERGDMSREEMRERWERFRDLMERARAGEMLTLEELRELQTMRDSWRGRGRGGRGGPFGGGDRGQRRFDLDGDGQLNAEEQAAMEAERMERLRGLRSDLEDRLGGAIPVSDENLEEFGNAINRMQREAMREVGMQERNAFLDQNGDGEITREEEQAARQQFEESADLDGDGETSREEMGMMWRTMMEDFQDRRGDDIQSQVDGRLINQYDQDADGVLNDSELSMLAREVVAEIETEQYMEVVDVAQNGELDDNEIQFYMQRFNAGESSADMNGDGEVDQIDLALFNGLVQTQP